MGMGNVNNVLIFPVFDLSHDMYLRYFSDFGFLGQIKAEKPDFSSF